MTTDTQAAAPELGKARLRKEDARLLTGQTNWTDNIVLPGMLHMASSAARSRTRGSPRWTSARPRACPA